MKQKRWTWREIGLPGPVRVWKNGKRTNPIRLYRVWKKVKTRTSQMPSWKKFRCAKYYRGVTMCEEWKYFPNFFRWAIENGYRDDLTIDRLDSLGGYCPANCRWATRSEQNKNRRYSEAFWAASRRNLAKANAALSAARHRAKGARR